MYGIRYWPLHLDQILKIYPIPLAITMTIIPPESLKRHSRFVFQLATGNCSLSSNWLKRTLACCARSWKRRLSVLTSRLTKPTTRINSTQRVRGHFLYPEDDLSFFSCRLNNLQPPNWWPPVSLLRFLTSSGAFAANLPLSQALIASRGSSKEAHPDFKVLRRPVSNARKSQVHTEVRDSSINIWTEHRFAKAQMH